jgi:hypothetical protein
MCDMQGEIRKAYTILIKNIICLGDLNILSCVRVTIDGFRIG